MGDSGADGAGEEEDIDISGNADAVECVICSQVWRLRVYGLGRWVDVGLPGNGNSNSHSARPVHLIITMIKRTLRLGAIDSGLLGSTDCHSGRDTTRAEDAKGTPTMSHISPSLSVYED